MDDVAVQKDLIRTPYPWEIIPHDRRCLQNKKCPPSPILCSQNQDDPNGAASLPAATHLIFKKRVD
jgi:hypothetical protein